MLRGDVYRLKLPKGVGREQHGARYAVVVQGDEFLPRQTVIVAPTSRSALATSYRPAVDVAGQHTHVLVEQMSSVDIRRLGEHAGHLTIQELWGVDEALEVVLGLGR